MTLHWTRYRNPQSPLDRNAATLLLNGNRPVGKCTLNVDREEERSIQPKYERLKSHLISEILAGRFKPGQAIPSEQHWAEMFGVAKMTVRQAMASLEDDGLIRRVPRRGNFVEEDARRKAKRGQDIFALVVPETRGGFYPALLHGFEAAAGEVRHQALICGTEFDVLRQGDVLVQLVDKEVGGVAMVPVADPPTPAYQIRLLQNQGVPVVFCHRRVEGVSAPLLAIPFREVGRLAGKTLAEHGHERVALFTSMNYPAAQAYEDGFRETLAARNRPLAEELIFRSSTMVDREDEVFAALERMFALPSPPTAIFATFDAVAEMIYLLLPRLGIRVPQDVSLLGFGGALREGALMRRLSSVVVDEVATGRKAVALLHEMRSGERPIDDNEESVMELALHEGQTLVQRNA